VSRADADEGVAMAAKAGAVRCGSQGDATQLFLKLGDDYHHGRGNVLRPHFYSAVVWSWDSQEQALSATAVPRYLYADELAKAAYYDALASDPASAPARAGLARSYVSQAAEIEARAAAGLDVADVEEQLAEAAVAVNAAGVDALDMALGWSVASGDVATGIALCRRLAGLATAPTSGLMAALRHRDGGLAAEAAVALGRIAYANRAPASAAVVAGLARAAGLEVLRLAVVIDGDAGRGAELAGALEQRGMIADHWGSGAKGLALLNRVPGIDAIVVADTLPDLTTAQVIDEIGRNERTSATPVFVLSSIEDAGDMYGERVAGTISGAEGADAIEASLAESLGADRDQANELAARAATTLAELSYGTGASDLSGAVAALTSTLAARPDSVTLPAMTALAAVGGTAQVPALLGVVRDAGRSDEARARAAASIAAIAGRSGLAANDDILRDLGGVLASDAALSVREQVSLALGRMQMTAAQRADLARRVRIDVSQ